MRCHAVLAAWGADRCGLCRSTVPRGAVSLDSASVGADRCRSPCCAVSRCAATAGRGPPCPSYVDGCGPSSTCPRLILIVPPDAAALDPSSAHLSAPRTARAVATIVTLATLWPLAQEGTARRLPQRGGPRSLSAVRPLCLSTQPMAVLRATPLPPSSTSVSGCEGTSGARGAGHEGLRDGVRLQISLARSGRPEGPPHPCVASAPRRVDQLHAPWCNRAGTGLGVRLAGRRPEEEDGCVCHGPVQRLDVHTERGTQGTGRGIA
jgi:hypothetical protein